jgi:SAM-dependent methyltransferase
MVREQISVRTTPTNSQLAHSTRSNLSSANRPVFAMIDSLKYLSGACLARLNPQRCQLIEQAFTLPYFDPKIGHGIANRLIRHYVGQRAGRDPSQLEQLHKAFWGGRSAEGWYSETADRIEKVVIPALSDVVQLVRPYLRQQRVQRVVELGTGNGEWLNYLSHQWDFVGQYVGIDLAEQQIASNQRRYPKLQFEAADLTDWMAERSEPNSMFVTHCGVLEYLAPNSLRTVAEKMAERATDSLFLLVEPLADNYPLVGSEPSRVHGPEMSYSHNYPYLLQCAGMQLLFQQERRLMDHRMLVLLANIPS